MCYDLTRGAPEPNVVGRLHTDFSIHRLLSYMWFSVPQSIAPDKHQSNKEARLIVSEKSGKSRAF